ncbi:hypothetical protein RB195_006260 [Necator americanus]|uniref:Endonuclease/exonuclease/phosphatase domain-containing protein n=1 Tax=Necator americanus TaxID=51031 RepID=A0ABR1BVC5_NECAM
MKKHSNSTTERFKTLLESCDLTQNIHVPTRLRSILDLVLSSGSSISDVEILPPFANSDHNVVSFMFDFNTDQPLYLPLPDFSRVNYSKLRKFLARVDWLEVFDNYQSVAKTYRRFCLVMYDSLAKFVPLKFNKNYVPTYPLHLRNLFDQKNRLFYQLDNPLNNALYRKICADLDYHMKKYLAYRERRLSKTCMKKFHNFLAKRIKQAQKLSVLRTDNGNLIRTDLEKANALAEFFASNHSLTLNERSHNLPLPTTDSSATQVPQRSFDFVIYPNEVLTVLKRLNPSFSCPYDGIPQIVYQKCADVLCLPIAHFLMRRLSSVKFLTFGKRHLLPQYPKKAILTLSRTFAPSVLYPLQAKFWKR